MFNLIIGVLVPFIGTTVGAFIVFFMRNKISLCFEKILLGFSAGVMFAASIWSLILPAIGLSEHMQSLSFIPAVVGVLVGVIFLFILEKIINKLEKNINISDKIQSKNKKKMLFLAITLHNIPEGMAVGVAFAGALFAGNGMTIASCLALAIGIAIQNIPEGAIISMPLRSAGHTKIKSFGAGVLSGIVEPIFAVITILLTSVVVKILPYVLSFAAGTMIYVVVKELIPESQSDQFSNHAIFSFVLGFVLMMLLDVALG